MEKDITRKNTWKKINYKEFEKLCREHQIEFNDDIFDNVHLDSGNLFAFYSEVIRRERKRLKNKVTYNLKQEERYRYKLRDLLIKYIEGKVTFGIIFNFLKKYGIVRGEII